GPLARHDLQPRRDALATGLHAGICASSDDRAAVCNGRGESRPPIVPQGWKGRRADPVPRQFLQVALDPARFADIGKKRAAAILQSEKGQAVLDRARIVPVIKDRQWLVDLRNALKAQGKEQEPLAENYNNELVIVYAMDDPTRMRYLMAGEDI